MHDLLTIISALTSFLSFQNKPSWTWKGHYCSNEDVCCVCSQCVTCVNNWTRKCCHNNCKTVVLATRSAAVECSRILQFGIDDAQPVVSVSHSGVNHPTWHKTVWLWGYLHGSRRILSAWFLAKNFAIFHKEKYTLCFRDSPVGYSLYKLVHLQLGFPLLLSAIQSKWTIAPGWIISCPTRPIVQELPVTEYFIRGGSESVNQV